ncbi:hypothetical protein FACS1894106_2670 [Spirochaetia bacterium]|nr:hypothetical protein FACS1894106_2670 [Spirochaetia bacterium]
MFEPKCPKCGQRMKIHVGVLMDGWYCPACYDRYKDKKRMKELEDRIKRLEALQC